MRPEQLALAWVLTRPEVTSVITGATRVEHVEHNLGAVEIDIPEDALRELDMIFPHS